MNNKKIALMIVIMIAALALFALLAQKLLLNPTSASCTTDECCTKQLKQHALFDTATQECKSLKEVYTRVERGNPAVEVCIQSGGVVRSELDEEGRERGICMFPDGRECEQWQFAEGLCE